MLMLILLVQSLKAEGNLQQVHTSFKNVKKSAVKPCTNIYWIGKYGCIKQQLERRYRVQECKWWYVQYHPLWAREPDQWIDVEKNKSWIEVSLE